MPARKPTIAFFCALLLMLGGALFGVYQLHDAIDRYRTVVKTSDDNQIAFDEITIAFKQQVQEWKNTLLRGRDPKDLQAHWDAFEAREKEVGGKVTQLLSRLPDGQSRALLEQFGREHGTLGLRYRAALDRLRKSGFDPAAGDAAVRGIDREPERLLADANGRIRDYRLWASASVSAQAERAAMISLATIFLAVILCVFVFLLL
jgi:methyl-accepting chemotaxis protein-1 (serine sensor receptor)